MYLESVFIREIRGSCLSLAFPSLIHLAEDIAPHSGVLGLLAEAVHVLLDVLWVDDTCCRSCCNRFESLTVSQFGSTWFASAFAVHSAVVHTRGCAVCKADFVFLGDLTVDFLHWECIFNLCHIVGIGLPQDRRKIVVGWPPSLLLNQNRLAILI